MTMATIFREKKPCLMDAIIDPPVDQLLQITGKPSLLDFRTRPKVTLSFTCLGMYLMWAYGTTLYIHFILHC